MRSPVTIRPETPAETVRLCRLTHDAALLRLTAETSTEADAAEAFRTGVELGLALWATRPSRSPRAPASRYVIDRRPRGRIRIRGGDEASFEESPRQAAEYLLRRLLGPSAVRPFAFELAQELATRRRWEVDRAVLAEWTQRLE